MGFHLSGVVATVACVPAAFAFSLRKLLPLPAQLILWHIASAGFAVSLAASVQLASRTTWLLGKKEDGSISTVGFALFWPYHIALRTKLALQRRYSSEAAWNKVTPTYYIGSWPAAEHMLPHKTIAVVDVTCELPLMVNATAYKLIPVWDTHGPSEQQLEEGVDWAIQQAASGRNLLVHCAHGHGRSAALLCAILLATGEASSVVDAEQILKAVRPRVRLNPRQKAAVTSWWSLRKKKQ